MIISKQDFIEALNDQYIKRKIAKGLDLRYTPPELMPTVESDQVLALVDMLYAFGVLQEGEEQ